MGDLKSPWESKDQAFTGTSTSGASIVSSGSDPNSEGGDGPAGLTDFWPVRALPESAKPSGAESSNSVSGLPSLPNRYEPAAETVEPPDLTTRSPGTIDKQ